MVMPENSMRSGVTLRDGGAGSALARIDQYELLSELGGGGFGTVYLARDTVSGVHYAVKGLPPFVKGNREELENIKANFALVSRLHHPNIAAALVLHPATHVDYASEDVRQKLRVDPGDTLMVMEYAPGVTLSQWRKQFPDRKVPLDKALEITRQIALALDYAHAKKILHRDVKPANVMIETGPDGKLVARVLDFGLAAEIRSSMGRVSREIHDTSGTRPYMAPEQWVGAKQGPATDQYALAALFCELVTGEVPFASVFETNDPMVMLNAVRDEAYVPPPDLPKVARNALARALAKKPGRRFPSCTAFANALGGTGLRWLRPVFSLLALLALGAAVCWLCGLDFGAGRRNEAQRLKDAAVELRERARLAHEDANRRGFASDAALSRQYREFERYYRAGMASYDDGNYASATNFFERAGEGMRQMVAEKRRLDAMQANREVDSRKVKEETRRLTRQFIDACKAERYVDAARVVESIDRDDAEVQFYLGTMYANGQGVEKDEAEAAKWYRKAAEHGHAKAKEKLEVLAAERNSDPVPVDPNGGESQSLERYCSTYKFKDGNTPVVVSVAWGAKPGRLMRAEELKGLGDYKDTPGIVYRMLVENDIHGGYDAERGQVVGIGTWRFYADREVSNVLDCGFADSPDDDFEMKRFKAMWKAYARALADIARIKGRCTLSAEISETEPDCESGANATSVVTNENIISMQLAGVTFLVMAESWAEGRYEVSVAMCQSAKSMDAFSRRSTGSGTCRGRYSIFEWLECVSKTGMICPQSYCDKDGVWWRIAGVPVGLDGNQFKLKDFTVEAKHYAYEAALRTIGVQVLSETRATSTMREGPVEVRRDGFKEHIKIDPLVSIPPLNIVTMAKTDPLTGKSIHLAVAFLSENDARMQSP